ncbi:MAG: hypothetical protein MI923_12690 [Phycisphaerales bacterium]|nr:hypothetical protein [Phycisphaerales bacterium]
MQLVIFEDAGYVNLLPLVYTRATFDLRCGWSDLLSKFERLFETTADTLFVRNAIAPALRERQSRPVNQTPSGDRQLWINGRLLLRKSFSPAANSAAWQGDTLQAAFINADIAARLTIETLLDNKRLKSALSDCRDLSLPDESVLIEYPWQLIHQNEKEIIRPFRPLEYARRTDAKIYEGAHIIDKKNPVPIGAGSIVKPGAVLDADNGPIYVGRNVTISPNVTITGPCYIGDNCLIQSGASIREGSSLGPYCKVGGEVEGCIFHGYSNKQHDGFLGHSYVGEWVNLGADTVTSDLKNTYGPVKVPINGRLIDSGEMFVGTVFGDHAKTGINTTLPTGCIIGFASNVFLSKHPNKFVPSFSWQTDEDIQTNDPKRALSVARKMAARRKRELSPVEESLFLSILEESGRHEVLMTSAELG